MEILVIDQGGPEKTNPTDDPFLGGPEVGIPIRWIDHRPNHLGLARALGVKLSRYEWVAFTDSDCQLPANWLVAYTHIIKKEGLGSASDPVLKKKGLGGIGAPNRPPRQQSLFYDAVGLLGETFFGHLNSPQMRRVGSNTPVSHLPTCNAVFRRGALLQAGNFSRDFETVCEDVEMGMRLGKMGWRLLLVEHEPVIHWLKPSFLAWTSRIFRYGRGQFHVITHHPEHLSFRLVLPLAFLCTWLLVWIFHHSLGFPFILLPSLYFLWVIGVAFYSCLRGNHIKSLVHLTALLVITHFSYALGETIGMTEWVIQRIRGK